MVEAVFPPYILSQETGAMIKCTADCCGYCIPDFGSAQSASAYTFDSAMQTPVESALQTPVDSALQTPVDSALQTPADSALQTPGSALSMASTVEGQESLISSKENSAKLTVKPGLVFPGGGAAAGSPSPRVLNEDSSDSDSPDSEISIARRLFSTESV